MDISLNKTYINMLKKQSILILGATPRSGISIANTIYDINTAMNLNIKYILSDSKTEDLLKDSINALKDKNAKYFFGEQDLSLLEGITLIIISPGIPHTIPLVTEAKRREIKIIGEIEFAYNLIPNRNYIAVTGTDGKTTTVTLIHKIINSYKKARLVGNVGNTFSKDVFSISENEDIVLELSSFQLETVEKFHAHISAILNIAEDHLDRYDDIQHYFDTKKNISINQNRKDFLILNYDNIYTNIYYNELLNNSKMKLLTFSLNSKEASIYYNENDENIYYENEKLFSIKERKILGKHNIANILAAILVCLKNDIPIKHIENEIIHFRGIEHRLEFVATVNGVKYINDSKATSMNSVMSALKSFEKDIILIMGGRNKNIDFRPLNNIIRERVKKLVLIGEAAEDLNKMIDFNNKIMIKDFTDAFYYISAIAIRGDTVLLSPGCTSFDMFKSYEDRGRFFKNLVYKLDTVIKS